MSDSDTPADEDRASAVYRCYTTQRRRPDDPMLEPNNHQMRSSEIELDDTITRLYRNYQTTREADYTRQVKQITLQAREDAIAVSAQQQAIKHIVQQARVHHPLSPESAKLQPPNVTANQRSRRQGLLATLLRAPAKLVNKITGVLSNLSPVAGVGLGAIATGIVAVMLFPSYMGGIFDHSIEHNPELLAVAPQVIQHVDRSERSLLSFSSSQLPESRAFQLGVIATDLGVAAKARNVDLIRHIAAGVINIDQHNIELARAATNLHQATSQSQTYNNALDNQVQSMQQVLSDSHNNRQWFEFGAQVETVNLSAEYAVQTEQQQPLKTAVAAVKAAELPNSLPSPMDALLTQLRTIVLTDEATVGDLREIRRIASSLKSVMY